MTATQQDIARRIGDAAGSAERFAQRALGANWNDAYVADWRVAAEIYELALAPAKDIQFLGLRFIRRTA